MGAKEIKCTELQLPLYCVSYYEQKGIVLDCPDCPKATRNIKLAEEGSK